MIINYLILAHNSPNHVKRLINRLNGHDVYFYIHIDAKSNLDEFLSVIKHENNVHFLIGNERKSIKWAGFEIIEATLQLMKKATAINKNGFCVLLSGQDYPIKSKSQISEVLSANPDKIFIEGFSLPSKKNWGPSGGMNRLNQYHFILGKRGESKAISYIFSGEFWRKSKLWDVYDLMRVGKLKEFGKFFQKRKFPNYLKPYGGSQWWSMPSEVVLQIQSFLDQHPDYIAYHKYTLCPDEIFFHSITFSLFPEKVTNQSTTYVNWIREGVTLPVLFDNLNDLTELLDAEQLFARKFDEVRSQELLNQIDEKVHKIK